MFWDTVPALRRGRWEVWVMQYNPLELYAILSHLFSRAVCSIQCACWVVFHAMLRYPAGRAAALRWAKPTSVRTDLNRQVSRPGGQALLPAQGRQKCLLHLSTEVGRALAAR